jgi:hypothetical protein
MTVNTNLEKLRLAIGDTDVSSSGANAIFKDAELNYFLSEESDNITNAALRACYAAMARFARAYDFETDGQRFLRSQMYQAFADLAERLEAQGASLASSTSTLVTADITKVDGYSEDIPNQDVSESSTNARQNFYRVGTLDRLP